MVCSALWSGSSCTITNLLYLSDTIRYVLPLNSNRSEAIVCHGELGIEGEVICSRSCLSWYFWQTSHFSIMLAISLLIPGQNIHMHAHKVVLVLPKWDMCHFASDTGLWDSGITIRQPFRMSPLTIQSSSLNEKYFLTDSWHSSAVEGHPSAMYRFNSWLTGSSLVIFCRFCIWERLTCMSISWIVTSMSERVVPLFTSYVSSA